MIIINGLPNDWFFKPSVRNPGSKELVHPWQIFEEINIPRDIRHLCEEHQVTFVFPPIEKGGNYTIDTKRILGLKFDFMTEAGQVLWEKIEKYVDATVPRDQRVPDPVLMAPNHRASYAPHAARRTVRGSLEMVPSEVPVINLVSVVPFYSSITTTTAAVPVAPVVEQVNGRKKRKAEQLVDVKCEICAKQFNKQSAIRMHMVSVHKFRKKQVEPATETPVQIEPEKVPAGV